MLIAFNVALSGEKKTYELDGRPFVSQNKTNGPKAIVSVLDNRQMTKSLDSLVYSQNKVEIVLDKRVQWIELEKNKNYSICLEKSFGDGQWNVKNILFERQGDCVLLQSGSFVKSAVVRYDRSLEEVVNINVLVGMKYIDLSQKEHLLGYNGSEKRKQKKDASSRVLNIGLKYAEGGYLDSLRFERIQEVLAVDEYKVTECEFVNMLWDSIPNQLLPDIFANQNYWISVKKGMTKGACDAHDFAAIRISPYYALLYANERSRRDGLVPVYSFDFSKDWRSLKFFDDGRFGIKHEVFALDNSDVSGYVVVRVDEKANGYRLPYYDEWMALARGGHANAEFVWGNEIDSSLALEYAWFGIQDSEDPLKKINPKKPYERKWLKNSCGRWLQSSRPVGKLKPNDFGLYDISGLVCESVMLPGKSIFDNEVLTCKGGFMSDSLGALNLGAHCDYKVSNDFIFRGLRLVRKLN